MRTKRKKDEPASKRKRAESPVRFRLSRSGYGLVSPSCSQSTAHCTPSQHMRRHRARYLQLLMDGLSWLTTKRTRGAQMSMSRSSVGSTGPAAQPGNSKSNVNQTKAASQKKPDRTSRRGRKPTKSATKGRGRRATAKSKGRGRRARGRPPARRSRRVQGRTTARCAAKSAKPRGRRATTGRRGRPPSTRGRGRPAASVGRPGRPPKNGIKQRLRGYKRAVRKAY